MSIFTRSMKKVNVSNFFKRIKKPLIYTAGVLISIILVLGVIAFNKREKLLDAAVTKAINKAKKDYNLDVKIGSYHFSGLSKVNFSQITVIPQDKDTLFTTQNLEVGVSLIPLIYGNIKISELNIKDAVVSLIKKDSVSNYDFLFRKDGKDSLKKDTKSDLSELANKLLNQALDKIPDDMNIQNFLITFNQDTTNFSLLTQEATIENGRVNSTIKLNVNQAVWHVSGTAKPSKQQLDLSLYADNKQKVAFPYLDKKYGLKLSFDTVRSIMTGAEMAGDRFEIDGSWSVANLVINQPRISTNDVIVKNATIDAKILIGSNYLALDSSSIVSLGKAQVNPFVKITLGPHKIYELKVNAFDQNAQDIFDAFPIGLFESLEGIKVKGNLKYALDFYMDTKKPNDVVFNSSLTSANDFDIVAFGKTDFKKINLPFIYTPYEKGKPVRDIVVGPSNPNYVAIENISLNIKNAVLTAEDPSFYNHKGFVEESIRQSIVTNFKTKSFKRGGSTLSMQLVKNIYLNRNKTLARKFEEILIVWLIENQKLTTKSRMFEVYLNIIEWGRNVYGIGEAARYYFGKPASDLTIGESIYLASIVPKPKSSLYSWQPSGALKSYLSGYFNIIGRLMANRGLTAPDSSNYGFYSVRLRESLRKQIAPSDYIPDSLMEDNENSFFDLFKLNKLDTLYIKDNVLKRVVKNDGLKQDTLSKKEERELRRQKRKNDKPIEN
jgi:hypothetical protein